MVADAPLRLWFSVTLLPPATNNCTPCEETTPEVPSVLPRLLIPATLVYRVWLKAEIVIVAEMLEAPAPIDCDRVTLLPPTSTRLNEGPDTMPVVPEVLPKLDISAELEEKAAPRSRSSGTILRGSATG